MQRPPPRLSRNSFYYRGRRSCVQSYQMQGFVLAWIRLSHHRPSCSQSVLHPGRRGTLVEMNYHILILFLCRGACQRQLREIQSLCLSRHIPSTLAPFGRLLKQDLQISTTHHTRRNIFAFNQKRYPFSRQNYVLTLEMQLLLVLKCLNYKPSGSIIVKSSSWNLQTTRIIRQQKNYASIALEMSSESARTVNSVPHIYSDAS